VETVDDEKLLPIGQVSRRTGLTVKAIRFYADQGIVRPATRNSAGNRMYDAATIARLELLRTLRDLGLDLPTVRRVLDHEQSLAQVAAAEAMAIATQIKVLRMRQAILTVLASGTTTRQELLMMSRAANLSQLEQQRLVDDFVADVFGNNRADPETVGITRSLQPELPDDPSPAQLEAWTEIADLLQDNEFRMKMRQLVNQHITDRGVTGGVPRRDLAAVIRDQAGAAMAAGVEPMSAAVAARYRTEEQPTDQVLHPLLGWLVAVNDPRRERYLHLLSTINEWPPPASMAPELAWTTAAVRARLAS